MKLAIFMNIMLAMTLLTTHADVKVTRRTSRTAEFIRCIERERRIHLKRGLYD